MFTCACDHAVEIGLQGAFWLKIGASSAFVIKECRVYGVRVSMKGSEERLVEAALYCSPQRC